MKVLHDSFMTGKFCNRFELLCSWQCFKRQKQSLVQGNSWNPASRTNVIKFALDKAFQTFAFPILGNIVIAKIAVKILLSEVALPDCWNVKFMFNQNIGSTVRNPTLFWLQWKSKISGCALSFDDLEVNVCTTLSWWTDQLDCGLVWCPTR